MIRLYISRSILFIFVFLLSGVILFSGCGVQPDEKNTTASEKHITIIDSIGRRVEIPYPVTRAAVSNNYTMEMIGSIGAIDSVCAIDYDMYRNRNAWAGHTFTEEQVFSKNQKNLNYEHTVELNPQVVILPDNGDWQEAEKKLAPFHIPVLVLNPYYGDTFTKDVQIAGKVFGKEKQAEIVANYFDERIEYIQKNLKNVPRKRLYVEYNPTEETTIPGDFFYGVAKYSGGQNIFDDAKAIKINLEEVVKRNPDYMVIIANKQVPRNIVPPTKEDYEALLGRIRERPGWNDINAIKNRHVLLISMTGHEGAGKLIGAFYAAKFLYPKELPDLHPEAVFKQWIDWQGSVYYPGHTYPAFELDE